MPTKNITFDKVVKKLHAFRKERGWLGLDSADLAKSIVLEAAELLEHYQWDNTDSKKYQDAPDKDMQAVASEVADIFIYILEFCHENNINLLDSTSRKIDRNRKKYPAKIMRDGGHKAYTKAKKYHRKSN